MKKARRKFNHIWAFFSKVEFFNMFTEHVKLLFLMNIQDRGKTIE
jgi:hypothetical protein